MELWKDFLGLTKNPCPQDKQIICFFFSPTLTPRQSLCPGWVYPFSYCYRTSLLWPLLGRSASGHVRKVVTYTNGYSEKARKKLIATFSGRGWWHSRVLVLYYPDQLDYDIKKWYREYNLFGQKYEVKNMRSINWKCLLRKYNKKIIHHVNIHFDFKMSTQVWNQD